MNSRGGVPETYASRVPSGEIAMLLPPMMLAEGKAASAPKSTSSRTSGRSTGFSERHGAHSSILRQRRARRPSPTAAHARDDIDRVAWPVPAPRIVRRAGEILSSAMRASPMSRRRCFGSRIRQSRRSARSRGGVVAPAAPSSRRRA